ncbi:MAG: FAD-linked oxidase C-terminal domain-containing protein [Actinomycetota bacterium]
MSARERVEARTDDAPARFAHALKGVIRGELHTDVITRRLYATDASPYSIDPVAVLIAAHVDDIAAAVDVCSREGISITARGAGTSLSGQCVGPGLNLDTSRLDRIEWIDAEARLARVQPGVSWWQLNRALRDVGLEFGPDPATKRQCTIGGMVGSNSGGTHSIVSGASVDHTHAIEAVLPGGKHVRLVESTDGTVGAAGAPPDLAADLERVREAATPLLGQRFHTLSRRGSGYLLEHLCADRPDAAKLFAGSEGTLGIVTAVELTLDPLPASRVLAVIGFTDLHVAMAAVPDLVDTAPCAVELVSRSMLEMARRDPFHEPAVAAVDPDVGALLLIEYQGDSTAEAAAGFDRMDRVLRSASGVLSRASFVDPGECARMWAIREAGIGAMSAVAGGPLLPQAFVEDTIVSVERLPGYIREFDRLFASHEMTPVWYGHASTGLIHVRPFLDMTSSVDLNRLESLMSETVDLVQAWGGDLCGEHGDGLSRTYWNERLFGSDIYAQFRALKAAFDPTRLLNPGKVVDGPHPLANLRYGAEYRRRDIRTAIDLSDQGGFASAVERCFGAGLCRKRSVGTMCPPAAATGAEEHSTRARANLLRSVVSGALQLSDIATPVAREVMETCVGCKACKTECPARVDMARLKVEWMDAVRRSEGARVLQRAIANVRALSYLGAPIAPVANHVLRSRWVKRRLGIASERALPQLVRRPLTARMPTAKGEVLLYPDCFITFQEPWIGQASARVLEAAGRSLGLAPVGCCGRVMLSEGYVDKARKVARRAAAALRATTAPIVFCEPSCLSAVTDDWQHLIGDVSDIAERCSMVEDYVVDAASSIAFERGGRVVFHPHCHQRALWGTAGTEKALLLVPELELEVLDAGCCGMAGAFGYLADRYALSKAMAERVLVPAVARVGNDVSVVATGTSCRHQISDLAGRRAQHPIEFLASRLAAGG